jgi:hypothetical protein
VINVAKTSIVIPTVAREGGWSCVDHEAPDMQQQVEVNKIHATSNNTTDPPAGILVRWQSGQVVHVSLDVALAKEGKDGSP